MQHACQCSQEGLVEAEHSYPAVPFAALPRLLLRAAASAHIPALSSGAGVSSLQMLLEAAVVHDVWLRCAVQINRDKLFCVRMQTKAGLNKGHSIISVID